MKSLRVSISLFVVFGFFSNAFSAEKQTIDARHAWVKNELTGIIFTFTPSKDRGSGKNSTSIRSLRNRTESEVSGSTIKFTPKNEQEVEAIFEEDYNSKQQEYKTTIDRAKETIENADE